tara:strand:- start:16 stop:303 length:288 start_codon:yes stop_codon:yes gene_type:complete
MRKVLNLLLVAFFISGCTPYQTTGFMGGFEDVELGGGRYKVSFVGNGYTSTNRAIEMATKRANELCKGSFDTLEKDIEGDSLLGKPTVSLVIQCK